MSWRIEHRGVLLASGLRVTGPETGAGVWLLGGPTWGDAIIEVRQRTTFRVEIAGIIFDVDGQVTMRSVGPDGTPRTLELRGRTPSLGDVVLDVR